jgi:hypothetical protein
MALQVQSTNLFGEVELLFQRLAQELPAHTANLRVYDVPGGGGGIELTPTNPASATISVFADNSAVYTFSFGLRSYWEFPFERRYRYDEKSIIAEIEEMSRAVLAGHCEETRGLVSISGRIHVRDYTYKTTTLPIFRLPRFGTRRYAPYAPQQP